MRIQDRIEDHEDLRRIFRVSGEIGDRGKMLGAGDAAGEGTKAADDAETAEETAAGEQGNDGESVDRRRKQEFLRGAHQRMLCRPFSAKKERFGTPKQLILPP